MKKTRQFDDIKDGELIRFLVEPPFYEKEKKAYWKFGIVVCDYMKNFFAVTTTGKWSAFYTFNIRKDGMDKSGKGAKQIAFRISPQEAANDIAILQFLRIREQIKTLENEAKRLNKQIDEREIIMFPEYPLPED
jgi:hypothetical protein